MDQFNSPIQGYSGWNVNQSYMTPSYMSNFRPAYDNGGERDNPFARHDSMWQSAQYLGPRDYSYGADSLQESSAHMYNITSGMGDAAASLFQNVGIPVSAWYGVSKLNGMRGGSIGSGLGRRMGIGASRLATGAIGTGARAVGLGGMARFGAGTASRLAAGAGGLGAFAGGMFLPIAAGQAVSSLMDKTLMDPYVATRRGMDAMRANTANQFISGAGQAKSGGFGMSATRAQKISQSLTEAGQGDLSLSGGMYNEIADNMMRAGIFQEVGDMDTKRVVDGVKKATSVLKLISRVTGDPDIRNGIQTLATLKSGGLDDIDKMGRAVNQLRASSAVSGVSMTQLLDTVGNQGMVMAQQQGMRGVTGLLASTDAFAGFTNARRAGLISGGQMQALGGAEGMTQNLMSGAYGMMNSSYSRMVMQGGGRFGDSLVDNISRWGKGVSRDPISSQGEYFANQGYYKEQAMNKYGPTGLMMDTLQGRAKSLHLDSTDGNIIAAMAQAENLSPEQFRSMAESDRAMQDPRSRMRLNEAKRSSDRSDYASSLQQDGLGLRGIPLLGKMQEAWVTGSAAFLRSGAESTNPMTDMIASASDAIESSLTGVKGMKDKITESHVISRGGSSVMARLVGYDKSKGRKIRGAYRDSIGLVRSDAHNDLIEKFNYILDNGTQSAKDKATDALAALTDRNKDKFKKLYREIDSDSKGYLSGSEYGPKMTSHYEDVDKLVDSNRIQGMTTSTRMAKVSNTLETDLNKAMLSEDKDAAIDKIMKDRGTMNEELLRTLGIDKDKQSGRSDAKKKVAIHDKMSEWYNREMPKIKGTTDSQMNQIQERFQKYGFSSKLISSYLRDRPESRETIGDTFNPMFGDTGDLTRKTVKELEAYREDQAKNMNKQGSNVDWSNLKDVTGGIKLLGPAVQGNTAAIEANTKAQIAIHNKNSWHKLDANDYKPEENLTAADVGGVKTNSREVRQFSS